MATNTIPLLTAKNWAAKWQSNPTNKIKAFLIPKDDLKQLFEYEGVCDVRTYFGINENEAQKLMLVGVDASENDLTDYSKNQFVYDFALACPDKCDLRSPLFNPKV